VTEANACEKLLVASKSFVLISASAGHGEFQKKSLQKSDTGKWVNLHIFKMAAIENFNVLFIVDFTPYKCISNR